MMLWIALSTSNCAAIYQAAAVCITLVIMPSLPLVDAQTAAQRLAARRYTETQ
jgi:hypothetical protein